MNLTSIGKGLHRSRIRSYHLDICQVLPAVPSIRYVLEAEMPSISDYPSFPFQYCLVHLHHTIIVLDISELIQPCPAPHNPPFCFVGQRIEDTQTQIQIHSGASNTPIHNRHVCAPIRPDGRVVSVDSYLPSAQWIGIRIRRGRGSVIDDLGNGTYRVCRGGSYATGAQGWRVVREVTSEDAGVRWQREVFA